MIKKKMPVCAECEGTHVKNQDYTNMLTCSRCVSIIAAEFVLVLRRWLTSAEIAEAVRLNKAEPQSSGVCHSHDFCDANMAMHEAFCNLGITPTCDIDDCEAIEYTTAQVLWNAAWSVAIASGFSYVLCTEEVAAMHA